ncbi:hypothetical protein BWI97_04065 [Siphonobacter sp. BAB-5405]|nr:hypothetical protein [Siphonobacter sp. BAB-5405]PMD98343.1 hypothetical protein BWI97_04065 [Siphonobacter sp. BAB-5405]
MKKIVRTFCLVFPLLSFIHCEKETEGVRISQAVLFEVTYTNQAWGKQQKGFLIDRSGNIQVFQNPSRWNWAEPNKGLTVSEVQENMEQTTPMGEPISAVVLQTYASKINALDAEHFSKRTNRGNDQGSRQYYAYRYDAEKQMYWPILLQETGDWETKNTDAAAEELTTWLMSVEKELK